MVHRWDVAWSWSSSRPSRSPPLSVAIFIAWILLLNFSRMQWFFFLSTFLTWGIFHFWILYCRVSVFLFVCVGGEKGLDCSFHSIRERICPKNVKTVGWMVVGLRPVICTSDWGLNGECSRERFPKVSYPTLAWISEKTAENSQRTSAIGYWTRYLPSPSFKSKTLTGHWWGNMKTKIPV